MWNPPPNVTEHNKEPLAADRDFFVAPHGEIGAIRTAHTSLKKGTGTRSVPVRVSITAAWGVVGFLLVMGFHMLTKILIIPASLTGTPPWLWGAIFALLPLYFGWRNSNFQHQCSFVGDNGCAEYRCEGNRETVVLKSVLLFQTATGLATRFTRSTQNGQYQSTKFYFHWHSADPEKKDFEIAGMHHADAKIPPADNPYNFGRSAEAAWYDYATPKITTEFARQGFYKFYMGYHRWAVLGNGFIEIVEPDGKASRCAAGDIGSATLRDGYLTIRRKDAKSSLFNLFDSEGVFGFNYALIHNARLFLYLFERSLGIRVQ